MEQQVMYEITKESSYCQVCGRTVTKGMLLPEGVCHLFCFNEYSGKHGIGLNN